jgi:hypothetical protein
MCGRLKVPITVRAIRSSVLVLNDGGLFQVRAPHQVSIALRLISQFHSVRFPVLQVFMEYQ